MSPSPLVKPSFTLCAAVRLQPWRTRLFTGRDRLLMLRHSGLNAIYCRGYAGKCQAVKGLVLGLTMLRQSRSPRARPSTSISAEARLLA